MEMEVHMQHETFFFREVMNTKDVIQRFVQRNRRADCNPRGKGYIIKAAPSSR